MREAERNAVNEMPGVKAESSDEMPREKAEFTEEK